MGSFANGMIVKADDLDQVCAGIETLKAGAGNSCYRVCQGGKGWVAVFDSNQFGPSDISLQLSEKLQTYCISFAVHDSDIWLYSVDQNGKTIDSYQSLSDEDYFGGDLAGIEDLDLGALEKQMAEVQEKINAAMPPEMQEIMTKMQNGTAGQEDYQKYTELSTEFSQQLSKTYSDIMGGLQDVIPEQSSTAAKQAASEPSIAQPSFEKLKPLLTKDDIEIDKLFSSTSPFAEDALRNFLELIGANAFLADLSYSYLDDFNDETRDQMGLGPVREI